jgi:HEAT repeat protein
MTLRTLLSISVSILCVPFAFAAEDPSVEDLWTKWKAGDEAAYHRLLELGPETRDLARRILKPEGEVFHKWPEYEEALLLDSMRADVVPELIKAIRSGIGGDRPGFLEHLESLGRMARPAGDAVVTIALEEDGDDRIAALRVLASAQTKKDFLIPEAVRLLSPSKLSSRRLTPMSGPDQLAAVATEMLSHAADEHAENALVQAIRFHPAAQVRERAVVALVRIAPDDISNVNVLIDSLDDNSPTFSGFAGSGSTSTHAIRAMLEYQELPAWAATGLIEKLYRESYEGLYLDPAMLVEAICRCPTTDVHAAELVARKIRPLLDEDAYFHEADAQLFRVSAASVVVKWYPTDETAAKFLAEVVNQISDRDFHNGKGGRYPDVRAQAADGLSRLGPAAKEWLPTLHQVMDREIKASPYISELAFSAAWAIAQIDSSDTECLEVLRLAEHEFLSRRQISWTKIESVLGQRAALLVRIDEVLTELRDAEFLLDHSPESSELNWTWMTLRPHREAVVPLLLEHLKSDRIEVRVAAARILGQMQVSPGIVVPAIAGLLEDRYATVRAVAAETLSEIGRDATVAIPALERAAHDEYVTVKLAAEDALSVIREMPFE